MIRGREREKGTDWTTRSSIPGRSKKFSSVENFKID